MTLEEYRRKSKNDLMLYRTLPEYERKNLLDEAIDRIDELEKQRERVGKNLLELLEMTKKLKNRLGG